MPGSHAAAIHLFSSSYYPMPIHSIQMLIAFVKTTDTSPLQIPSIISKIPKTARAGPIHLDSVIFRIIFSLSVMIIFYFETFLSSFSTISFHSSSVWLPEYVSPTIFPSLSTKNVSGKAEIPFKRPFIIVESGTRNG